MVIEYPFKLSIQDNEDATDGLPGPFLRLRCLKFACVQSEAPSRSEAASQALGELWKLLQTVPTLEDLDLEVQDHM